MSSEHLKVVLKECGTLPPSSPWINRQHFSKQTVQWWSLPSPFSGRWQTTLSRWSSKMLSLAPRGFLRCSGQPHKLHDQFLLETMKIILLGHLIVVIASLQLWYDASVRWFVALSYNFHMLVLIFVLQQMPQNYLDLGSCHSGYMLLLSSMHDCGLYIHDVRYQWLD